MNFGNKPLFLGLAVRFVCLLFMVQAAEAETRSHEKLLDILVASYPIFLKGHDGKNLIWKDGTRMPFDDGNPVKSFEDLLNAPDLEDQFFAPYKAGARPAPPGVNQDPGRVRFEPFFKKMYGDCKNGEVQDYLVSVPWLPRKGGKKLRITRRNNVARKLMAVSRELDRLPDKFVKYLVPAAGTYNCRNIAGTARRSVHAFGAAIDINIKRTDYWRWRKPDKNGRYAYRNQIPLEIIKIFEKHGFIWGGRWYHYDTMHFEYRPELIRAGRLRF